MIARTKGNLRICSVTAIVYSITISTKTFCCDSAVLLRPVQFQNRRPTKSHCPVSEMPVLLILDAVANGIKL